MVDTVDSYIEQHMVYILENGFGPSVGSYRIEVANLRHTIHGDLVQQEIAMGRAGTPAQAFRRLLPPTVIKAIQEQVSPTFTNGSLMYVKDQDMYVNSTRNFAVAGGTIRALEHSQGWTVKEAFDWVEQMKDVEPANINQRLAEQAAQRRSEYHAEQLQQEMARQAGIAERRLLEELSKPVVTEVPEGWLPEGWMAADGSRLPKQEWQEEDFTTYTGPHPAPRTDQDKGKNPQYRMQAVEKWEEVVKTWQDCKKANYDMEETAEILYTLIEELLS